jgi:hypothetical protein
LPTRRRRSELPNVPWITSDGHFDPTKFPIDSVLKQALSEDPDTLRTGCTMLGSMAAHGRTEATVHLLGLLRWYQDDLERLSMVVEQLSAAAQDLVEGKPELIAKTLVGELRRVKSSNKTRRYLGGVLDVLSRLPAKVALPRLEDLADDKSFSPKMRAKFRAEAEAQRYRQRSWDP